MTEESGRLAQWLRLLGYDATATPSQPLTDIYRRAYNERRIVLTRNRRVGTSQLFRVIQLTSTQLSEQLRQLVRDVPLEMHGARFTRCDVCNVPLQERDKSQVRTRVPDYVFQTQARFRACPSCGRIYWAATHCRRIETLLDRLELPNA